MKPLNEFWKVSRNPDGHHHQCKVCAGEYAKKIKQGNAAQRTAYNRQWRKDNPTKVEAWRPRQRAYMQRRYAERMEVLHIAYGRVCYCCGESNPLFLTFDHVDGVPPDHRTKSGKRLAGTAIVDKLYYYLQEHDQPDSRCRLSCYNCNCGREKNGGVCPHQEEVMPNGLLRTITRAR